MVEEVTTQSWGGRIGNAFFGILIGIALIVGAFILIFWNEGSGLHTAQSLQQTQQALISVPDSPINPQNNLKPIYLTGIATTSETLNDDLLGVSVEAIRLIRKVEMYQWQEKKESQTEKQYGGSEKTTTTYTYHQVWSPQLIDSSNFKDINGHQNPNRMEIQSMEKQAQNVTLGDFTLPNLLVDQISNASPVDLSEVDSTQIKETAQRDVQVDNGGLYVGSDPSMPQIGDLTIKETQVLPQTVSIIAQQTENTLQAYTPRAGKPIALLESGQVSSDEMIHNALVENQTLVWVLRLVSLFMMIFGIGLILRPLSVLADVIPFMGSIVGFGTGLIAFVVGLLLWGVATALAWFIVRPLFAIGLLIFIIIISFLIIHRRRQTTSINNKTS